MRDAGNWCIVILLIKLIGHRLVDFTADHQRMSSATFVIKGEHIDVYHKLILVQMDIVG